MHATVARVLLFSFLTKRHLKDTMWCLVVCFLFAWAPLSPSCISSALALMSSSCRHDESLWLPLILPHVSRRQVLSSGLVTATMGGGSHPAHAAVTTTNNHNIAIDSHGIIPVWPTWGGGRVVPVTLGDPFLLLAHHKHWFDPRDPLRKPFQVSMSVVFAGYCLLLLWPHTLQKGSRKGIGIAIY